jgi:hypothetical protein
MSDSSGFKVTLEAIQEWLDDDLSLQTLSNQYTLQEIYDLLPFFVEVATADELYTALLDAMYATRPGGDI